MNEDELKEVIDLVRADKMYATQKDADRVQAAWVYLVRWNTFSEWARLGNLPDPDRMFEEGEKDLERWLVKSFAAGNPGWEKENALALARIRRQIVKEARKDAASGYLPWK